EYGLNPELLVGDVPIGDSVLAAVRARAIRRRGWLSPQALRLICSVALALRVSISFRMSSTFQAVIRGPSLKPLGNRPAVMPAHQVDRETGNTDNTARSRMYPSPGIIGPFSSALICSLLL